MNKYIYLLWARTEMEPAERRRILLEDCAPKLDKAGAAGIIMNIADEHATTPSPAPKPLFSEPFVAQVNIWTDNEITRLSCQDILRAGGFELHGYRVDEWLYTDYGENEHERARDWPDGERSPGILAVTLLKRPNRVSREKWMQRWFGHQSPMSEWMQPRSRYVRNIVEEIIIPGTDAYDGIVEEAWPSGEHVTNPKLFYGAKNWFQVIMHMGIMLKSVMRILNMWNITTVMLSEYFVKTPPKAKAGK